MSTRVVPIVVCLSGGLFCFFMGRWSCRSNTKVGIPSTSTNTQSAAIAQIAAELEGGVRIANIGGVPSAEQLSKWARQLRAL